MIPIEQLDRMIDSTLAELRALREMKAAAVKAEYVQSLFDQLEKDLDNL